MAIATNYQEGSPFSGNLSNNDECATDCAIVSNGICTPTAECEHSESCNGNTSENSSNGSSTVDSLKVLKSRNMEENCTEMQTLISGHSPIVQRSDEEVILRVNDDLDSVKSVSSEIRGSRKRKFPDDEDKPVTLRSLRPRTASEKKGGRSSESTSPLPQKKKRTKFMRTKQKADKIIGINRCKICRQTLNSTDLKKMEGHPHNSVEETVALVEPKFTETYSESELPQNKLTHFSIYDANGHLCPLDGGVIERNLELHASGYMKAVYDDDPTPEGGIPVREVGPIYQWWIGGFDGGEKALVGISTESAEYLLMEPSPLYAPLMESVWEKIYLGKLVIEFLSKEESPTFEDLLNHIQTSVPPPRVPKITEDTLIRHAQFVCDQVSSYDDAGYDSDESDEEEDFEKLINTPCMETLIDLAGATFSKRKGAVKNRSGFPTRKSIKKKSGEVEGWSKATTTPLVNEIFETFFADQLDSKNEKLKPMKKLRCGVCEACQQRDCGTCKACSDMVKFGGTGLRKQSCLLRKCPNVGANEPEVSDSDGENISVKKNSGQQNKLKRSSLFLKKKLVEWVGELIITEKERNKSYYRSAKVGDEIVSVGDYVSCQPQEITSPVVIGRIQFLWESSTKKKYMHLYLFCRGCETVLGETADPQELFATNQCENTELSGVISKVNVHYSVTSPNWGKEGGLEIKENAESDDKTFFYSKKYIEEQGHFDDIPPLKPFPENASYKHCNGCIKRFEKVVYESPELNEPHEEKTKNGLVQFKMLKWKNDEYKVGQCVYLKPDTFKFVTRKSSFSDKQDEDSIDSVDEDIYPELYRKTERRSQEVLPLPFCIGLISNIKSKEGGLRSKDDVILTVYKMYRPENTRNIVKNIRDQDLTKLYSSNEEVEIKFSKVVGKCYVAYEDNVFDGNVRKWCSEGPDRFYVSESYDAASHQTVDPIRIFKNLGSVGKGGGKGKSGLLKKITIPSYPVISRPLKCLDVFAGCGGLSEGLHQSGVAETKWAIEKEEAAANAFKINNPKATVFTDDCNYFLKAVMNGETKNDKGQSFPKKGEVELLVGGPPCQGFSGMNRFNSREYSIFKNSLIVSYLSFCEYYRPRFFILENVRNFVSFKRNMILKLTMRCLLKMGYQVAFGVLQAGHYGVPQTRRRVIIMAAAPGEILPKYPEPLHVFYSSYTKSLKVIVDDNTFTAGCHDNESAPFRTTVVYDAMSDLPEIENGHDQVEMLYNSEAVTHFQKMMRDKMDDGKLKDHICKNMSSLVGARMAHVPKKNGSDWRDLPNIIVKLSDGTYTKKLVYEHHDAKNGKSSTGALRGVCQCAVNGKCDPMDRQFNTLIPWCLPHTGNRHNQWSSLYGRLEWNGIFSTTVTNPEPMGKQGRVLHPTQNRVVSVRECARSQGFPDRYRFFGGILDKHRQVGNAVPPPMGKAIGLEILKAVHQKESLVTNGDSTPVDFPK